ncbi:glycosyltransferase family 4 protein [Methanolobus sp.]|uniref:glycosyltransferase family 4 protein n=1 Tax=Methanolobus sp. TaxID=1874737 RepID=UPI0025FA3CB5|nr:glycosyltransferase family 4 protein [Methanolobus sp.]
MKICIIELVNNGGMVHYASQLCNSLSRYSTDNKVFLIAPNGINDSLFDSRVVFKKIPSMGRHGYRIDLIWKYIFEIKPDITHITVIHPFIVPLLRKLKKHSVLVSTIHDVTLHSDQKNIILNLISSLISKSSDLVFVHGEKLKQELTTKGILNSNIAVIPHGDYSFFGNINHKKVPEEKNTILFFGRILKYKGIDYLIKAESILSSKLSSFKIIIAGNGDFSQYNAMIKDFTHFEIINEYIPDEKVSELFQKASVIVLPYIEGSQSGVVPIAYSFKKPVVVTNVGCISDVVIDGVTGFVVQPKDTDGLATAILKILLDNNLRAQMGVNAYEFMKGEMSWDGIAEKTILEYSRFISSSSRKWNEI